MGGPEDDRTAVVVDRRVAGLATNGDDGMVMWMRAEEATRGKRTAGSRYPVEKRMIDSVKCLGELALGVRESTSTG